MRLSILDQAPVTKGNNAVAALKKAEELAVLGDELGYHRMWMAEHHGTNSFASSAPEVTAAHLAAKTERIRIGTGGVMMMHNMYEKFETALQYINDEVPEDELYNKTIATPSQIELQEAWLLGSKGNSAIQAGRMGVGYSFAQFFMGGMTKEILDAYRKNFEPTVFMEKPEIKVTYLVTTAEMKEEAEFEALPQDIARLWLMRGKMDQSLTPEEAQDYPLTEMDRMTIKNNRKLHLVGSAKEIASQLQKEQEQYGFDEAMICSIPHSQEKRLEVYRLLARELL